MEIIMKHILCTTIVLILVLCVGCAQAEETQTEKTPTFIDLTGHTSYVQSVAFSPDGKKIVTTSMDETARIWDAQSGEELKQLRYYGPGGIRTVADSAVFSPDGKKIVTASGHKIAKIWDAESGKELQKIELESDTFYHITSAAFSPDGKKIVTEVDNGITQLWDAESGKELQKWEGSKAIRNDVSIAIFSPCGKKMVRMRDPDVVIYDTESGKALKTFKASEVGSAAFSPDGTKIIVTKGSEFSGYFIQIWDAESGEVLVEMEKQRFWIRHVAFSPDGKKVVAMGNDQFARIWDAKSGKLLHELRNKGPGHSAAFSPDGKRVATNGNNERVRIWKLE